MTAVVYLWSYSLGGIRDLAARQCFNHRADVLHFDLSNFGEGGEVSGRIENRPGTDCYSEIKSFNRHVV